MLNQSCIAAGTVLLQWGIVSEKLLANALIQTMTCQDTLLQVLLKAGHITIYQQLFVLMEKSSIRLSEISNVAGCYSTLPTTKQA